MLRRATAVREAAHRIMSAVPATSKPSFSTTGPHEGVGATCSAGQQREALTKSVCTAVVSAEAVVEVLLRGDVPEPAKVAALIVETMDGVVQLLECQVAMLDRFQADATRWDEQTRQLQLKLETQQKELDELRTDSDRLLFREMATQAVSKVLRKVRGADMSARDARFMPLSDVEGTEVYREVIEKYPLLKSGIQMACNMARPVAHPCQLSATEEQLRSLIPRVTDEGCSRRAAEDVLACLLALQKDMNESLFVVD